MSGQEATQHSLAEARKRWPDATVEIVEHWDAWAPRPDGGRGRRRDLFGWGDILVVSPTAGHIIIQSTTQACVKRRIAKILGKQQATEKNRAAGKRRLKAFHDWISGPRKGRVFVWGWVQPKGKGTRWVLDEAELTAKDLPA